MKSLVVSVCITAVTDMAAVSLLVFFWCSSGFFWVLLAFFWRSSGVLLCYRTPEERQKNTRRTPEGTPEEPRRTQKEKNTSPPDKTRKIFNDHQRKRKNSAALAARSELAATATGHCQHTPLPLPLSCYTTLLAISIY